MHLEIKQNTGTMEQVTPEIIGKLYNLSFEDTLNGITSPLDSTSDIQGRLVVTKASKKQVKYLAGIEASDTKRFDNLYITVTGGYYIDFEDPIALSTLLNAGLGDGIGITETEASTIILPNELFNGSNIETFDELLYFPLGASNFRNFFYNCHNLRKVTFPRNGSVYINKDCMFQIWSGSSADLDVDWNGCVVSAGNGGCLYNNLDHLTFKDSLIPPITDFKNIGRDGLTCFQLCTALQKVIFREGIETTVDKFFKCASIRYMEFPSTITDMGGSMEFLRDSGNSEKVMVIKAVTPPRWTYTPNNTSGHGEGMGYGYLPNYIYVPDNSVNAYKNVTPLVIGSGVDEELLVWCKSDCPDKIKPLSQLPQTYRDMGTVTQADIDRV